MSIRTAREDDAPAIAAAYQWLFDPPGLAVPGWDAGRAAETLRAVMGRAGSEVFVAEQGGAIAGLCTVYLDIRSVRFGQRAWVEDLAVDPAARSLGLGKGLLDAAKAWARERGASHLELDSGLARTDAHRFYQREGAEPGSYVFAWRL